MFRAPGTRPINTLHRARLVATLQHSCEIVWTPAGRAEVQGRPLSRTTIERELGRPAGLHLMEELVGRNPPVNRGSRDTGDLHQPERRGWWCLLGGIYLHQNTRLLDNTVV